MPITSIVPISPIVNIDVSSESKVILLPAASTCIGTTFTLRDSKGAASTNAIFVSTIGLDRVDGDFLYPLRSTLETLKVMSLGNTSWSLVQRTTTIPSILASGTFPLAATITSLVLIPLFVSPYTAYLYISWIPPPPIRVFNFDSYTIIDPSGNSIPDVSNNLITYPLSNYLVGLNTCRIITINKYGSSSSQPFSATISGSASLTWTERSGLNDAVSITSSSDATKLAGAVAGTSGGSIYTSTNSGVTWTERTGAGSRSWSCIASSSDGTKLAATVGGATSSGLIYTSTDSGATWTEQDNGDKSGGFAKNWRTIASSSDGTKLAAGVNGEYIYTSIDSGATWTEQTNSSSANWISIASSSDGTKLFAVASTAIIYRSTDGGTSWSSVDLASAGPPIITPTFRSITCSSDGTKVAAAAGTLGNAGYIYTSTDSGATWTMRTSSGSRVWSSIASSSDATKLAATVSGGSIYVSTDSGADWTSESGAGSRNWTSIASASDGVILAASVSSASAWTRVEGPPTPPVAFFPNSIGGRVIQTDAYDLLGADGSPLPGGEWVNTGTGGTVNCSGTVNTNVLNGQRVITFSPASSWIPATEVALSAYSMFFVTRQTGTVNGTIFKNAGFTTQIFGYQSGQKKIFRISLNEPYRNQSAVTSDTSWDIISHTRTQASSYVFNWNGSLLYSGETSANLPLQNLIISGPLEASDCQVAEVILYNSVLTSTQISKIEGYLAWKWGLVGNLPSSHPYKTSYPTV